MGAFQMAVTELTIFSIGAKVPRIPMNVNDADYVTKSKDENNYFPAVLAKLPNGKGVIPVIVSDEDAQKLKVGDSVFVELRITEP
jgi:hypothetical protein